MYTDEELNKYNVKRTKMKIEYVGHYMTFPNLVKEVTRMAKDWGVDLDLVRLDIISEYDDSGSLYVVTNDYPMTYEEIKEALEKAKKDKERNDECDRQQFERLKAKFGDK